MNHQIITCDFCELKRLQMCLLWKYILCLDCCFGDDVTPEGVTEYCCENNNDKNLSMHKSLFIPSYLQNPG